MLSVLAAAVSRQDGPGLADSTWGVTRSTCQGAEVAGFRHFSIILRLGPRMVLGQFPGQLPLGIAKTPVMRGVGRQASRCRGHFQDNFSSDTKTSRRRGRYEYKIVKGWHWDYNFTPATVTSATGFFESGRFVEERGKKGWCSSVDNTWRHRPVAELKRLQQEPVGGATAGQCCATGRGPRKRQRDGTVDNAVVDDFSADYFADPTKRAGQSSVFFRAHFPVPRIQNCQPGRPRRPPGSVARGRLLRRPMGRKLEPMFSGRFS